jgi:DNA-binding protein YbaB
MADPNDLLKQLQEGGNMPSQDELMKSLQEGVAEVQGKMQDIHGELDQTLLVGRSNDETVTVTMSATYAFKNIEIKEDALKGGLKKFEERLREAFENVTDDIRRRTQEQTMKLFENMPIPDGFDFDPAKLGATPPPVSNRPKTQIENKNWDEEN